MNEDVPPGLEAVRLLRHLAASAPRDGACDHVHVTRSETCAEAVAGFLAAVARDREVLCLPPWDSLPYDSAPPSAEAMGRRMAALLRFREGAQRPFLVVTTPQGLLQRLPPPSAVVSFLVEAGRPLDEDALRAFCRSAGYTEDDRIDEPGEIALRGEVIDIFPGGCALPYRIDIADGIVTGIRCYDPATQRSLDDVQRLTIVPVTETPPGAEGAEGASATLFDHLPDARLSLGADAERERRRLLVRIDEAYRDRREAGSAPPAPGEAYIAGEEWPDLARRTRAQVIDPDPWEPLPGFAAARRPRRAALDFIEAARAAGRRVVLVAPDDAWLTRLKRHVAPACEGEIETLESWSEAGGNGPGSAPGDAPAKGRASGPGAASEAEPGDVVALKAPLDRGFVDALGGVAVVTAADLLGHRAGSAPDAPRKAAHWRIEVEDLHLGDVVVHEDHGLARLAGLERVETEGTGADFVALDFARDRRLLVPVEEAGRLWRYGSQEAEVTLDRMDGTEWMRRRRRIEAALAETAREMAARAAEERARRGRRFDAAGRDFEAVVARFPHPETPDQRQAIRAVLDDLASGRRMDRLVIGDVGFGKTEVALRAIAAVALSGAQAALVAPTTVLARQHFDTVRRRLAGTGVEVCHLSRLTAGKAATEARARIADGRCGVVVGTHALLSDKVAFADLGLMVIDEEQRFGTAQKKRLREMREEAHVLAMTATPIPRTLQSSLVGLHEISEIATPPARRRPIRTLFAEGDGTEGGEAATLRQALLREKRRGGQSFVIVPRVEDIEATERRLRDLVPDLDLRVAHGRLPARAIDETMVGFAAGDGDVLLATGIIESGLDVPRANTMIVLRPQMFGLAQLHQLRGRVGRSHRQAWCYLMPGEGEALSEAARRRLGTLVALDRLGAGMAISARDLDQRGAGELFGQRQAGHAKRVGAALYQDLLAVAARAARGEPALPRHVALQVDAAGSLPPDYIPEEDLRINLHHRLARAATPQDADALAEEVADRFGPPPPPVRDLLRLTRIRALARAQGVERISAGPEGVALEFAEGFAPPDRLQGIDGDVERAGRRLLLRRHETDDAPALVLDLLEACR